MKSVLVVALALRNASVEDGAWQLLGEYGFTVLRHPHGTPGAQQWGKPIGPCEHWAVPMMEPAAFMLSPQVRHGREEASLLVLFRPLLSV